MRVMFCLGLLLAGGLRIAAAPVLVASSPEDAGFDGERLGAAAAMFRESVARDGLRGVVLLVARHGKIAMHEAIGWRDKAAGLPMEQDTLFHMASNTKAVTATAALMLAEAGKLSTDDRVARHIPAFDTEPLAAITIDQLLSNSSGLPRSPIFMRGVRADSDLAREAERFAATLLPEHPPGTCYGYSNAGFNILGGVIEAAAGERLDRFFHRAIHAPLGMDDTHHHESAAPADRMGNVHQRGDGGEWTVRRAAGGRPLYPIPRASGGMISTAGDFAIFLQMWLNGGAYGETRILTPESVARATSVRSATDRYGYGWRVDRNGAFSHGGSDGTYAWVDPGRGIIGIILTQSPGGDDLRDDFRRLINSAVAGGDAD